MQRYPVYVQAIRDDFCLYEVCHRLLEDGAEHVYFCIPNEYWSGGKTNEADIQAVVDIAKRLGRASYYVQDVGKHRAEGRSRIDVETDFRNESLQWIWSKGHEHTLIADGDELWFKGYLGIVDHTLQTNPQLNALGSAVIPTIGLPGYPIDNSTDEAVIYMRKGNYFNRCRTPQDYHVHLENRGIFHFSATRRTIKEIVEKHRGSGHYGDPDYDFEGWIKDVLPNIRPGSKNVHCYKKFQIWPVVRAWRAEELSHIPQSLYRYLALNGQSSHFQILTGHD